MFTGYLELPKNFLYKLCSLHFFAAPSQGLSAYYSKFFEIFFNFRDPLESMKNQCLYKEYEWSGFIDFFETKDVVFGELLEGVIVESI